MNFQPIIDTLDAEIEKLQAAKQALLGMGTQNHTPRKRRKFRMSAEARARIGAAQRARWAKLRRKAA